MLAMFVYLFAYNQQACYAINLQEKNNLKLHFEDAYIRLQSFLQDKNLTFTKIWTTGVGTCTSILVLGRLGKVYYYTNT